MVGIDGEADAMHGSLEGNAEHWLRGTVTKHFAFRGFGFAEMEDGSEIFLPKEVTSDADCEVDDEIECTICVDEKGRPQARCIRRIQGTRLTGQVKSYKEGGFGFIRCDAYEDDVFLHSQQFRRAGCKIWDKVSFEVHMNSRGQPQARHVRVETSGSLFSEASFQTPRTCSKPSSDIDILDDDQDCVSVTVHHIERRRFEGRIISFGKGKGFGFIQCDEFPQNVFLHLQQFEEACCGVLDDVSFEVQFNAKSQPQARSVRVESPGCLRVFQHGLGLSSTGETRSTNQTRKEIISADGQPDSDHELVEHDPCNLHVQSRSVTSPPLSAAPASGQHILVYAFIPCVMQPCQPVPPWHGPQLITNHQGV